MRSLCLLVLYPVCLKFVASVIVCLWKSKTGLGTSNSVVHRVIFLTLETAFLPSISMVTAVIVLHGAPNPVRLLPTHSIISAEQV